MDYNKVISETLSNVILGILPFVLIFIASKWHQWMDALKTKALAEAHQVKNDTIHSVLDGMIQQSFTIVDSIEQVMMPALLEQAKNGQLTKDKLPGVYAEMKKKAVDALMASAKAQATTLPEDLLRNHAEAAVEARVRNMPPSGLADAVEAAKPAIVEPPKADA